MKRILFLLAAVLAAVFAAVPALAGSAHFVGAPLVSVSGASLTVSAKEAGLGDLAQIHVVLAGTASCINPGGHGPQAVNKTSFTAAADEPVQNGHSDYSLTATAVFQPPCSPPMTVQFSDVTLTDTSSGISGQVLP